MSLSLSCLVILKKKSLKIPRFTIFPNAARHRQTRVKTLFIASTGQVTNGINKNPGLLGQIGLSQGFFAFCIQAPLGGLCL